MMRDYVQEAIVVTLLTLGLAYAYKAIPKGLQDVKDAARSPRPEPVNPPPKQLPPDAEDKIEVDTLRVLSEGHSFELRTSAIKIVAARAVTTSNRKILLQHLACKNPKHRDEAINALWLLYGHESQDHQQRFNMMSRFQDKETFEAIVTALINLLPLHNTPLAENSQSQSKPPPSPVRPFCRPPHETKLMQLLIISLRGSNRGHLGSKETVYLEHALNAGLVSRWLAEYPFPCTLPQFSKYNYKASDVCSLFASSRYRTDDELMYEIFHIVSSSSRGSNQLRAVGLKAFRMTENISRTSLGARRTSFSSTTTSSVATREVSRTRLWETDDDTRMIGGEDTAGEPMTNWTPIERRPNRDDDDDDDDEHRHLRSQERSQEEMSLRRRNRETFVIVERGQPLGRQNILRRRNTDQRLQELADERRLWRETLVNGGLSPSTMERARRIVLGEESHGPRSPDGAFGYQRTLSIPLLPSAPVSVSSLVERQVQRRASTGGQPESSRAAEARASRNADDARRV